MTATTTSVPLPARRIASILERMVRAYFVAFIPFVLPQIISGVYHFSAWRLAAIAAISPALSALLSALGISIPGLNPATPSLLPAKLDPTTPQIEPSQEIRGVPTGNVRVIQRAAAQAGHSPIPTGSSWTGPIVTDCSPWPDETGRYAAESLPQQSTPNAGPKEYSVTQPTEPTGLRELYPSIGSYGWKPQPVDDRDWQLASDSLPFRFSGAFVDLSAEFPDSPYDQGQLGSCVGNGTAAVVDFARVKQGLTPLRPPSRLFIYYEGRKIEGTVSQDSGLYVRDGIKAVATVGAPPETDYPYDISRFTDAPSAQALTDAKLDVPVKYLAVGKGQIYDTVASGYPVVFGFDVPADFEGPVIARNGVMPLASWLSGKIIGGHCTVVVSTPQTVQPADGSPAYEAVKIRNSWGSGWGDSGYFWMPTQFLMGGQTSDFWMVSTVNDPAPQPTPGPTPTPTPTPGPQPAGTFTVGPLHPSTEAAIRRIAERHSEDPTAYLTTYIDNHFGSKS